jgi:hypothetical protein
MAARSTIDIDPHGRRRKATFAREAGCLDGAPSICMAADGSTAIEATVMTTFDKREEGFEQQFAHDEELRFKATARRDKLLGLWAAEKLGLAGAEADSYALSLVMAAFEDKASPGVLQKIRIDFDAKGVAQSDHQISRHADELMAQAIEAIRAGK